ncbi:MAG: M10 family metallopeptidase C-terminal domain-containing protein [Marinibacterium sp.]
MTGISEFGLRDMFGGSNPFDRDGQPDSAPVDLTKASASGVDSAIATLKSVLDGESTGSASFGGTGAAAAPNPFLDMEMASMDAVIIDHSSGCPCPACANDRSDDTASSSDGATAATPVPPTGGAAAAPAGTLSEMADFLTTGYWTQSGTVTREFNLTGSGLNPKSGVLHYNVTGFTNAGSAGTDADGLSTARANLVRDVLDVYGEVLGITFVETTSSSTAVTDLFFKDNDSGAYASSAGYSAGIQYSWVNVASSWSGGTSTYNDYTLQTIFHEVGHALGLGHQGLYNGSGSYATDADFLADSWQASMMSYFSQTENTAITADFAYLQTPMSVDWIALQDIYGSQSFGGTTFGTQNAFTGDTVYGFNTNITSAVSDIWAQFATYADVTASTIIDAGGIDTLDVSGYGADQLINLAVTSQNDYAPSTSNIGGLVGNLTLADGTVIENAVGGSGNDTFFGNGADNTLTGNAGDDTFTDSDGADTYYGGADTDTVSYETSTQGVGVRLNGTSGWNGAAGDTLHEIENLIGSGFNDTLAGSDQANVIDAGDGDDTVYAKQGNDTIETGLGADRVYGQGGIDTVTYANATQGAVIGLDGSAGTGGAAGDTLFGVENLIGSAFGDTLTGNNKANTIQAGGGNDTILLGAGADTVDGGTGTDTVSYANATGNVGIRLNGTTGWGAANGDTLTAVENLTGSDFNDTLVGDGAGNFIAGGAGNDTIYAKGGQDILVGGTGNDTMYGQGGSDVFAFADGFGNDTIHGFDATDIHEKLYFVPLTTIADYTALTTNGHLSQVGLDVLVDDLAGNTITLLNVNLGDLDQTDFLF